MYRSSHFEDKSTMITRNYLIIIFLNYFHLLLRPCDLIILKIFRV